VFADRGYRVHVFTGDVSGAGTDANVFVSIYGENGDTGERQLKESQNKNKFERAQEDVFDVEAADLGKLRKLKVWHDNSGIGAAWFLDRIEVVDTDSDRRYDPVSAPPRRVSQQSDANSPVPVAATSSRARSG
jgi:lipoxygenase homology domain-containing protein 1